MVAQLGKCLPTIEHFMQTITYICLHLTACPPRALPLLGACMPCICAVHDAFCHHCASVNDIIDVYLHRELVVLVQVVRHSKCDPVVAIVGLQDQQLVPRLHEAWDVTQLDLQGGSQC
jgi:hypothetical protein